MSVVKSKIREQSGSVSKLPEQETPVLLRLYLAGATPSSRRAVLNLEAGLKELPGSAAYGVEHVDILVETKRATADCVIVTPTLIAIGRHSHSVIIGDLSDKRKLRDFLESAAGSL